jgi:succinate dehydrogenase/fumarate reductase cytochrome b subunit
MYKSFLLAFLIALPGLASAQSLQMFITGFLGFINEILIPFSLSIAFLIFVFNAIRYFVYEGNEEDGQENAKSLALYSIAAFVFILSFWGLVNIVNDGVGLDNDPCENDTTSDYIIRDNAPCEVTIPPSRPAPQPTVRPSGPQ